MVDLIYGLDPLVYGEGGIADYPAVPDDALVDANGDIIGVTDANFSGDHSCYAIKANLTEEAKGQLLYQFKERPRIEGMLSSTTDEVQELENVFADLKLCFQLDYAEGAQLLEVAKTVGIFSAGQMNDDDFRMFIKAKVIADMSAGHGDDFILAFRAMIASVLTTFDMTEGPGDKEVTCEMGGDTLATSSTISNLNVYQILRRIVAGGVALWYHFFGQAESDTFTFAVGPAETVDAAKGFGNVAETTGGYFAGVYGRNHL